MKPFEEYYYIGKPNDETILPYYFYEFVCLVGDKEEWFKNDYYKINEWDTVLVKGRWRDGPRRNHNEEIDSMEDYYVVHKDDTQEIIKEHYPDIDSDATNYIIEVISLNKIGKITLDRSIEFMWQKLGLEEKCVVERKT